MAVNRCANSQSSAAAQCLKTTWRPTCTWQARKASTSPLDAIFKRAYHADSMGTVLTVQRREPGAGGERSRRLHAHWLHVRCVLEPVKSACARTPPDRSRADEPGKECSTLPAPAARQSPLLRTCAYTIPLPRLMHLRMTTWLSWKSQRPCTWGLGHGNWLFLSGADSPAEANAGD